MRDFEGFRFGNVHSEDLHLVVVSSSNRFDKNLLPAPTDYTSKVPGGDGSYYFGSTFENREISINVAFDSVSEMDFRRIQQLFATDKPDDLVFDEMPFKTFRAKLKSKPDFKVICFTDKTTGERVYKGEGTLNFICYYPYAFGFNKYVVRAADYYKCLTPEQIIANDITDNPYEVKVPKKQLTGFLKDHYNVKANLHTPWKGGFPTIEQVQSGELYFNDPTNKEKKMIIDVRGYWRNVPEWQSTAKLLTTPTLDYDQELIFMPQYSKTNYYNMDTGLNKQNGMIGSRILVYNPGDLPVDFELKLGNLSSQFRDNLATYKFRVSRYNVQRLTIEQAVDWTGLKTYKEEDDYDYKYGTRYFTIAEPNQKNANLDFKKEMMANSNFKTDWRFDPTYKKLKASHPNHAYIVEPIPKEKLGYFIRLFYWQSSLNPDAFNDIIDYEEGLMIADRYEELYDKCITEDERNELYWKTLKEAILKKYELANNRLNYSKEDPKDYGFLNEDYSIDDFIQDYLYNPPEYIKEKKDLKYGQFDFNIFRIPDYYTFDYLDINNKDFDKLVCCSCGCDDCITIKEVNRPTIKPLSLDTDRRMLYNISNPKWKSDRTVKGLEWQKANPDQMDNYYNFKPIKTVFNDNIEKGHWFKLPPGWSLIDVSPIIDEDAWGGKTWLHASAFKWGTNSKIERDWFNMVYRTAAEDYLTKNCPPHIIKKYSGKDNIPQAALHPYFESLPLEKLEEFMQFRFWYSDDELYGDRVGGYADGVKGPNGENIDKKDTLRGLGFEFVRRRSEQAEYRFLKQLAEYWRINQLDENGMPCGDLDDWWWYANNYLWANFPPLYWGYADLLNKIEIDYTPLFY